MKERCAVVRGLPAPGSGGSGETGEVYREGGRNSVGQQVMFLVCPSTCWLLVSVQGAEDSRIYKYFSESFKRSLQHVDESGIVMRDGGSPEFLHSTPS